LYLGQKGLRVKEKTATDNCTQLLMLVRTACNLKTREAAEGASTSLLTADIVKGYQDKMIKGLKGEKEQRARRSANSTLVQARSIFARYIMADKLYPNLPDISGFLNVRALPAVPKTFRFELIDEWCQKVFANLPELRENDPAAYLYVRLAAGLGLRAREISEARISWIVGAKGGRMLFVQPTETWIPKGRKERKIPLGEDIYHDIVALTDGSEWIVPAENANQRKEGISKRVCVWMTALGWPFDKKVHELRRWFGAQVATQTGSLFDAQRVLGHASHETTNQYYADLVKPPEFTITMGVGQGEPEQSGQRRVVNN
jgi:integrase